MRHSEFKNKGNRMPLMNNLDDYTPWADSMETISWLDKKNYGTSSTPNFLKTYEQVKKISTTLMKVHCTKHCF